MNEIQNTEKGEVRDTLLLSGGAALVVLGAGLLMTNSTVRKTILAGVQRLLPDIQAPLAHGVAGLLPDVERYFKMRKM
jgi:hypothetical protein